MARFHELASFALKIVDNDIELKVMYIESLYYGIHQIRLASNEFTIT